MLAEHSVKIFFDEEAHKYTDEYANIYTSTTTVIGNYSNKFDVKSMARNCARAGRKGNPKYKGKTEAMLEAEWAWMTKVACDEGNDKHNFLERTIKQHTGYNLVGSNCYINSRIHTVVDIVKSPTYGILDIQFFESNGIKERYLDIYNMLYLLHNKGFRFYAEIGVFNIQALISGLVDLLAIRGNDFYIIDWKTNKAPIRFEAGYFKKDNYGNLTNEYVFTAALMKYPLSHLEDSTGNKYALQLSMYANLIELFVGLDLHCLGIILCHITKDKFLDRDNVKLMQIPYLKEDVNSLMEHHKGKLKPKRQTQMTNLLLQL